MFIVFDGLDGAGKSTQIAKLVEWLQGLGKTVVQCRDPGGTSLGEEVRRILLDKNSRISLIAEMLLYMAARAQLVEEVIQPALVSGHYVVCDRFLVANIVYQGDGGGLPLDAIRSVGAIATQKLQPNLTLILDMPLEEIERRMQRPLDRMEAKQDTAYRTRLREGYHREAAVDPGHIVLVDAIGDANEVFGRIRKAVLARSPHLAENST